VVPQLVAIGSHHVEPFNADFYLAAATLIPVFFIALMFPGGVLARYSVWTKKWRSKHGVKALQAESYSGSRLWLVLRGHQLLSIPVDLTLVLGSVGEVCAVIALDHRYATGAQHGWVFASAVILPFIAAASAMMSVSRAWAADLPSPEPPDDARAGSD
jgi:hypothetical protein